MLDYVEDRDNSGMQRSEGEEHENLSFLQKRNRHREKSRADGDVPVLRVGSARLSQLPVLQSGGLQRLRRAPGRPRSSEGPKQLLRLLCFPGGRRQRGWSGSHGKCPQQTGCPLQEAVVRSVGPYQLLPEVRRIVVRLLIED